MDTPWPAKLVDNQGRLRRLWAFFRSEAVRGLGASSIGLLRTLWYEYAGDLYRRNEDALLHASCFPSIDEMAEAMHCSARTVRRAMAERLQARRGLRLRYGRCPPHAKPSP